MIYKVFFISIFTCFSSAFTMKSSSVEFKDNRHVFLTNLLQNYGKQETNTMVNIYKKIMLPSYIKKYLNTHVSHLEESDIVKLSKILARESLLCFQRINKYSNPIKKPIKTRYYFPVFNASNEYIGREVIKLPFNLWIEKTDKGIECEIIGPEIGKGSCKKIYETKILVINNFPYNKSSKDAALVCVNFMETKAVKTSINFFLNSVCVKDLHDCHIAPPLTYLHRESYFNLEARDILYQGDLDKLYKKFNLEEKLEVLKEITIAIKYLFRNGLVHGDVKTANILVASLKPIRVCLADFDYVGKIGSYGLSGTPSFIDNTLCCGRLKLPFLDIYGLAKISAQILFDVSPDSGLKTFEDVGTVHATILYKKEMEKKAPYKFIIAIKKDWKELGLKWPQNLSSLSDLYTYLNKIDCRLLDKKHRESYDRIKKYLTKIEEVFKGINMVMDENLETANYLEKYLKLKQQMQKGNKEAFNVMLEDFVGFKNFLNIYI